jgi:hypothetical protein
MSNKAKSISTPSVPGKHEDSIKENGLTGIKVV